MRGCSFSNTVSIHVSEVFFLSVASGLACCSFRWLLCRYTIAYFLFSRSEGLDLSFTLFLLGRARKELYFCKFYNLRLFFG